MEWDGDAQPNRKFRLLPVMQAESIAYWRHCQLNVMRKKCRCYNLFEIYHWFDERMYINRQSSNRF
jgi:hypothetical protein